MKEKFKQTTGRIADSIKDTLNFIKDHPKEIIIVIGLGGGAYAFDQLTPKANAAEILAKNSTSDSGFGKGLMYIQTKPDANEAYDPYDGSFLALPNANELEISSNEPGFRARVNAKPENTPESNVDLAVRNAFTGTINNSLKLMVTDATGLEHRKVQAYNSADPDTVYDVSKQLGVITEIILPDLVNPSAGQYAGWIVATPAIVPGDIAGPEGKGKLDGTVDFYDIMVVANEWLSETFVDENYNWSDMNYDGNTNFGDFTIPAGSWLESEPISKATDRILPRHKKLSYKRHKAVA